jgi:serine protease Do
LDALPMVESLSDLINPRRDLLAPLGIFIIDINEFVASALPGLRSKHGVVVAGILGEEPATLVKLEVGDVIRSINGKAVQNCDEMRQMMAGFKPGDSVALEIERQSVMEYLAFEVE